MRPKLLKPIAELPPEDIRQRLAALGALVARQGMQLEQTRLDVERLKRQLAAARARRRPA